MVYSAIGRSNFHSPVQLGSLGRIDGAGSHRRDIIHCDHAVGLGDG